MKLTISTVLFAILLPATALAQAEIPTDGIGIYSDPEACYYCASASPYQTVTMYLIALRPSDLTGIARWECRLYTQPDPLPAGLGVALAGGGVNELTAPNFRVALPAPLVWDQMVVLATFSTFYLGGEILMGLGPSEPSSVNDPASPAYLGAGPNSPWRRLALATASGCMPTAPGVWAAYALNGGSWECYHHLVRSPWCYPVSVEQQSWGAIKGLYQ